MADLRIKRRIELVIERTCLPLGVRLGPETLLFQELNLTSLSFVSLILDIEHEFEPLSLPDDWLSHATRVADLIGMVERAKNPT